MNLVLIYSQPRPASYDPEVVINEKKELVLDPMTEIETEKFIKSFLEEGSVVCGPKTYRRNMISLQRRLIPPQSEPKPEFYSIAGLLL